MARIQANDPFKPNYLDFNDILSSQEMNRSSSKLEIIYAPGFWDTYVGSGFTFAADGVPTGGTIHSLTREGTFGVEFKISGVSISLMDVYNASLTKSDTDDVRVLSAALSGKDTIIGSSMGDVLSGYAGNDLLLGRGGKDALSGGTGRDTFRFDSTQDSRASARDTITDFKHGQDKIDLRKIDADQDGTAGNQSFKFIGSRAFSGQDGELRFSGGTVYGDVNGDGAADFAIKVSGVRTMYTSDFLL
jgi:Ca2+-binding RTX toxin-like protein